MNNLAANVGKVFLGVHLHIIIMDAVRAKELRLSDLKKGEKAVIKHHEDTDFRLTLMEMGCVPGEAVWIEMIAPMGDPIAIQIAGYYLSIRKKDAESIWVATDK